MTASDFPGGDPGRQTILGLSPWTASLALVGAATLLRLGFLFLSPLQLYPDEAQYWTWSRHLLPQSMRRLPSSSAASAC